MTTEYVAISKQVRKYIVNDLHVPARKTRLIYNGIDIKKFKKPSIVRKDKLAELGMHSGRKIITNIGRITEEKGQLYLIKAVKIIINEFPNTHFIIVGNDQIDKKLTQELRQIIEEENLHNHITFTGIRHDVEEIMAITDIFVLPSLYEGFSLVALEAMAARLPIVATNVGIIPEIIINRENGLIVPRKDEVALADGIKFFLSNLKLAQKMGCRARKVTEAKFTIENTVKEYEKLYLEYF